MIVYDKNDPLTDFRNFLSLCWHYLHLPKPTDRQLAIAYFMQYGPRRRMVEAFRGVGKSWIAAAFVMFCLRARPELNIMVVSASKLRADNFTTFCMRLMQEVPELQHLQPRDHQRSSKTAFDVALAPPSQSPSVYSAGITGQITGSRADLIVPDDVEIPSNSDTQLQREKLGERVKEFDAVLKPDGHIVYLGTPQTQESLYKQLTKREYVVKVWPVRYPTEDQIARYGPTLAADIIADLLTNPKLVGKSTEPTRFTDLDLREREISYGRAGFNLQFMLDPDLADADRHPLKLGDLCVTDLDPDFGPEKVLWASSPELIINDLPCVGFDRDHYYRPIPFKDAQHFPYTGSVMAIDPSGRGKDETAYAVVNFLHGNLCLMDAGGLKGYGQDTMEALANIAKKWKIKHIVIEGNFGDGMFDQLLRPVLTRIYPVMIEGVKHSIQKEKRIIDTLEPVMSGHRLLVNKSLIVSDYDSVGDYPSDRGFLYRLFYQMAHITRDKGSLAQDDRLDAVAMAVAYWVEQMARDVDLASHRAREKRVEKGLRDWVKSAFRGKVKVPQRTPATRRVG